LDIRLEHAFAEVVEHNGVLIEDPVMGRMRLGGNISGFSGPICF